MNPSTFIQNLKQPTYITCLALFLFSLCYYIVQLPPGITFEDAGYFLSASLNQGYAHPPGYPLYTLLLNAWASFGSLFSDNPAFLGSLFSAVLSALSISLFYLLLTHLSPNPLKSIRHSLIIVLTLLAATGFEFVEQSLLIEVYSLHITLLMLLFSCLRKKCYFLTGIVTGLALSNHSTAIFFFAFVFFWLILIDEKPWKTLIAPGLSQFVPGTLAGLTPYLYLPFVANPKSPLQWGQANTYEGFKEIVFRTNYWKLPGTSLSTQWQQLKIAGQSFADQWGYIIPLLFLMSFSIYFFKSVKNKKKMAYWHLCWFIQLPVMAYLASMGTNDEGIKMVSVFFIPAYFFTLSCLAIFIVNMSEMNSQNLQKKILLCSCILLSFNIVYAVFKNFPVTSMSQYKTPQLFTEQVKGSLGTKKAILLTWNDFTFTPVAYQKYVKKELTQLTPIPYSFFKDLSMLKKYQKMHDLDLKPLKKALIKFYQTRPTGHIGVIPDEKFYPALAICIKKWLNQNYDVFVEYRMKNPGFETLYFDPRGPFFQIRLNKPFKESPFVFLNKKAKAHKGKGDLWQYKFYAKYAEQSILKALLNPNSPNKDRYLENAFYFSKNTDSEIKIKAGIKKSFPQFKLNDPSKL